MFSARKFWTKALRAPGARLRAERGVTYLMVMFSILLMGVSMSVVGKNWSVVVKRDSEAEFMFRGNRFKAAIEAYAADYEVMKATRPTRYPTSLEQLTEKQPKRYLPVVYKDPLTGEAFELVKVGAEIRGVRSKSQGRPFDTVRFKNVQTYSQILFQADAPATKGCQSATNPVNQLSPFGNLPCQQPGSPHSPPQPAGAVPPGSPQS